MIAILMLLALISALTALAKASGETVYRRKPFILLSLFIWAPLIAIAVVDIMKLSGGMPGVSLDNGSLLLAIWFLVTSYFVFTRVCWRLNDIGWKRWVGYAALIPYLNLPIFLVLGLVPSKSE
jgi:hypothetical protein